jgi:hypothetical protein
MAPGSSGAIGSDGQSTPGGAADGGGTASGPGDYGGMGADNSPPDYRYPETAVVAFLNALKAKDPARLKDATALRAPTESDTTHQKMFKAIQDQSLPDNDLSELAKALEGFQVYSKNVPKSTGRVGIILRKQQGRDQIQRTITVRLEKAGWKVLDIGAPGVIEAPIRVPGGMRGRRR